MEPEVACPCLVASFLAASIDLASWVVWLVVVVAFLQASSSIASVVVEVLVLA